MIEEKVLTKHDVQLKIYLAKKDIHALESAYYDGLKRKLEASKRVEELKESLDEVLLKKEEAENLLVSLEGKLESL